MSSSLGFPLVTQASMSCGRYGSSSLLRAALLVLIDISTVSECAYHDGMHQFDTNLFCVQMLVVKRARKHVGSLLATQTFNSEVCTDSFTRGCRGSNSSTSVSFTKTPDPDGYHQFLQSIQSMTSKESYHYQNIGYQEQQLISGIQAHTLSTQEPHSSARYDGGNVGRPQPQFLYIPQSSSAGSIATPISAISGSTTSPTSYLRSPYTSSSGESSYSSPQSPTPALFHCRECGQSLRSRQGLKEHTKAQHNNRRIPCPDCEMTFSYPQALRRHKREYRCPLDRAYRA
ncbi:hypothetical protein DFH05DRAFT_250621 [Lentinula detonsa]|uniref:C2H2-type domain-containing protein n=1 Tax=Lentinula detonsa TaxID=2804962 RepID=A0A9W8NVQ7_9AGAR|nr:hypothetical protein DFH05DRAFT_250621 [Lentinula detonsa]